MDVTELRWAATLMAVAASLLLFSSRTKNMEQGSNLFECFLFILLCGFVLIATFGSAAEATIALFNKTVILALQRAGSV
jgi:hypothetical protein